VRLNDYPPSACMPSWTRSRGHPVRYVSQPMNYGLKDSLAAVELPDAGVLPPTT
jgi:hypothetical protein